MHQAEQIRDNDGRLYVGWPSVGPLRLPKRWTGHYYARLPKRWARHYYAPLWFRGGLLLSLRSFRIDYSSTRYQPKQLCINFRIKGARQLVIRAVDHKSAERLVGRPILRRRRLALRLTGVALLLALSIYGSLHYAFQLSKPSSLYLPTSNVPATPANTGHSAKTPVVTGPTLSRSVPTSLSIPSVDINTQLVTTALNPDNTIEVPSNYHEAGWYEHSPTPGQVGPSIIVGHVDNVAGLGVFWELRNVKVNDQIYVTRADGQTYTFKVTDVKQVPKDNFPTKEVYGNINYAGLRLITCGGVFNHATHEYNLNTVVFAALVK